MALQIEIVSDVVCPWCFIGKRRLEQALGRAPDTPVSLRWRPFQLNPQLPAGGVERAEYVRAKFGARATEIYDRVARVGRGVGIDFAFDRIVRQPNTLPAHQLIGAAAVAGVEEAMVETLFRAYFLEGADLTSRACLLGLAARAQGWLRPMRSWHWMILSCVKPCSTKSARRTRSVSRVFRSSSSGGGSGCRARKRWTCW
jgi:predicted DsbA family dithiol-disulfide isomerase